MKSLNDLNTIGILRFTPLMWGHVKEPRRQKPHKSKLVSSTKREEDRIELQTALRTVVRGNFNIHGTKNFQDA